MVIRVFVASSSGSVAVSEGERRGEQRGRRGQGSAGGAGDCRGWQLVLPRCPACPSAPSLGPESVRPSVLPPSVGCPATRG